MIEEFALDNWSQYESWCLEHGYLRPLKEELGMSSRTIEVDISLELFARVRVVDTWEGDPSVPNGTREVCETEVLGVFYEDGTPFHYPSQEIDRLIENAVDKEL